MMASLLEITDWGGIGAEALKNGIDNIFGEHGPLSPPDYNTKLISCTADGAAVNFGRKSGLLTHLDADRGWLVNQHTLLQSSNRTGRKRRLQELRFRGN